jgi:hypothetical protein
MRVLGPVSAERHCPLPSCSYAIAAPDGTASVALFEAVAR